MVELRHVSIQLALATALRREGTYAAILRSSRHAARYVKTRTFFTRESSDAMRPGSLPLIPCASKDHAIASRLSSTSAALAVSTPDGGEVLDLLENETGMHSCLDRNPSSRRVAPAARG